MRRLAATALVAACAVSLPDAHAAELAGEVHAGYLDITNARRSAKAVFDGVPGGALLAAGARVDLGPRHFWRLSAGWFSRAGERAFVADPDSPVFRLGHPLKVRLVSSYVDLGRRFRSQGRLRPYLGLGIGGVWYTEEATVGNLKESDARLRPSARAVLGVTRAVGSAQIGAEIGYSRTPRAIGSAGVSKVYGESDVGGVTCVVTLGWRP